MVGFNRGRVIIEIGEIVRDIIKIGEIFNSVVALDHNRNEIFLITYSDISLELVLLIYKYYFSFH